MLSQLSQPRPLKNANWKSLVLSRFQRSEMLTMCRSHDVPGKRLVGGSVFRFEGERMSGLVCRQREGKWHIVLCVTIDSVRINFGLQIRDSLGPRFARI